MKGELRRNQFIIFYSLGISIVTLIFSQAIEHPISFNVFTYLDILFLSCFITLFCVSVIYYVILIFSNSTPGETFLQWIRALFLPLSKPLIFLVLILCVNLCFSTYTYLKSTIPYFNGFSLDELFVYLDKRLHFNVPPWTITHSIFSSAYATLAINVLYNLWFFVKWGLLIFFLLYRKNEQLRMQFLMTFLLSWLLIGNVTASFLSSSGPVFIDTLNNTDYYTDLIERLHLQNTFLINEGALPLWALNTQDILLNLHLNTEMGLGAGISAMPSMHVTIAVLTAISLYAVNVKLGVVGWLYALMIQIGSVHLGWHYAIDGYVGAVLVIILWYSIGWLLSKTTAFAKI